MKKLFILAILICWAKCMTAQNAKGQFSVKPMAGINISTIAGGEIDGMYKSKVGFTGGAEVEYGVNDWLGLSLGMMYSQQGAKVDFSFVGYYEAEITEGYKETFSGYTTITGKMKTSYLNLPLLANFYIPAVKGLSVKTGVQVGILTSDKLDYEIINANQPISGDINSQELGSASTVEVKHMGVSMSDFCKSVDFGIPVGLSYEYKNVSLDARYYFGLTNIDNTKDPEDIKNRYFSITLGYRFGL